MKTKTPTTPRTRSMPAWATWTYLAWKGRVFCASKPKWRDCGDGLWWDVCTKDILEGRYHGELHNRTASELVRYASLRRIVTKKGKG